LTEKTAHNLLDFGNIFARADASLLAPEKAER
jgi:hypothetical protein